MIYEALLNYDNDVVIKGNRYITTPQELYQALVYKDTSEIRMHRDFAETFFTPSGLSDFVQNAQTVNPHCTIVVDADVRDFRLRAIKALESYTSIEEVIFQLQAHPREMMEVIKILCENYTDTYSETLVANNKVSALQLQNSELIRKLEQIAGKNDAGKLQRQVYVVGSCRTSLWSRRSSVCWWAVSTTLTRRTSTLPSSSRLRGRAALRASSTSKSVRAFAMWTRSSITSKRF